MIALKTYQERVLGSLSEFFKLCSKGGQPASAFQAVQLRNNPGSPAPYLPVNATGLSSGMPYVCLRVPTGGGKTLLACHAAGLAIDLLLQAERGVVLWLVPSNTILDQTADALRDQRHPYKGAHLLENAEEKLVVGRIWASRSDGHCLFLMPSELDFAAITVVAKKT